MHANTGPVGEPLIHASGLSVGYGDITVARGIDIAVQCGEIVALFGPNGAGKSTILKTLAGGLPSLGGSVSWLGQPALGPVHRRARNGLVLVPEGRSVLMSMNVRDNLLLGQGGIDVALDLFPELRPLLSRSAGLLSGGEQQMVSLARALACRPRCLLIDELSLGLAPIIVDRLLQRLSEVAGELQAGVLMVEQQARRALTIADRWLFIRNGSVVATGATWDDWFDSGCGYFGKAALS